MQTTPEPINRLRSYYTYRCAICGWECRSKLIPGISVPITQVGDYGSKGTPEGETFADELYSATSIAFVAATGNDPAKFTDSLSRFGDKLLKSEMPIRISTTSGTNDGDYTIAARGVSRGEIRLSDSDSLTSESAATAGTVVISRVIYKPNITRGCPSCGTLASRGEAT
jgi:hypothetical protein